MSDLYRTFPFRVALLTGASGDLGSALSKLLAESAVELILLDRDAVAQQQCASATAGRV